MCDLMISNYAYPLYKVDYDLVSGCEQVAPLLGHPEHVGDHFGRLLLVESAPPEQGAAAKELPA